MTPKAGVLPHAFKAKVALEALKNIEPVHTIAARHGVHPTQVSQWNKELTDRMPEVFARGGASDAAGEAQEREKERFEEVGRLKMELEWLNRELVSSSVDERRRMIEPAHPKLSVTPAVRTAGSAAL
jgi:transposase-like protein